MKYKFLTIIAFLLSIAINGQNVNVTGTISEAASGQPLPGVNVILKNTTTGTSTDFDGKFILNDVPLNSILVISYVGFKTQEITITNDQPLSIALQDDAESLNEVVVIGYGTQKKKEITGAVSVVSSETIETLKPTRIEQALQGQVAGVNIVSNSGSPGAASTISIRGVSTNGDTRPLILVDGTVVEDLSVINPNDIESVNILKDATAGIYGVRAANGVILITTKSGRKNMPLTFEINTYGGIQETTRKLPLLNATEYALLLNESYAANGDALPFPNVSGLGLGTNWQDEVFESAPIFSNAITMKGGGEKSTYAFGSSFLTQDGIVGGSKSNFTRLTKRASYSLDFLENFKLNTGITWTHTVRRALPETGIGSVLFNAVNMAPTIGVNGAAENLGFEVVNPLKQIQNTYNRALVDKLNGNINLSYNFLKNFTAQASYQWNYAKVDERAFSPFVDYGIAGTQDKVFDLLPNDDRDNNSVFERQSYFRDYTFDAFVKYENSFNDTHNVNVLLGTSVFKTSGGEARSFTGFGIRNNNISNANLDEVIRVQNNNPNRDDRTFDSRLLSYFTRLQYDYKGKYLLSAVVRRDGSSNFGPENKFGIFPSGSIGWIASDEPFLEDNNIIDFFKIRASYGVLGNDRIGSFGFVSVLDGEGTYVFDNTLAFGSAAGRIGNPEIRWEKQKTFDVGVDMRFWDNKFDVTVDYFKKRTEDLLVSPQTSGVIGAAAPGAQPPIINAGIVENKGFEVAIGYNEQISDDFKFSIKYNVATLDNNVVSVSGSNDFVPGGAFGIGQDPPSRMEAGQPIGYFRGFRTNGIFQNQAQIDNSPVLNNNTSPGDIIFVDVNGDGVINDDDRTNIGDPIPDATMGLNLTFDYKNFDFGAYAFASVGNDIVRNYERNLPNTNRTIQYLNRWTGEGSTNSFPRVTTGATNNTLFSDFYVEDGSFIRLQNVQLGYSISPETAEKWGLNKLRIYVSASNLVTLTEYQGYDPTASTGEPIGGGIDYGFYPNPRTYLLGMNLKF